jgi:hypothetical protein
VIEDWAGGVAEIGSVEVLADVLANTATGKAAAAMHQAFIREFIFFDLTSDVP